jgi:hypothetical protein
MDVMARILISEPHRDVRQSLVRMVGYLGYEPLVMEVPSEARLPYVDLLLVEPADPIGAVFAKAARLIRPEMPIVFLSVEPPPELDIVPVTYLKKPFSVGQLSDTIESALAS